MKRVNKFRLRPTKEQEKVLFSLCEMSAVLWNKLNYIRRQAFFEGRFDWREGVDELYDEFKRILGSATTQQIIRKNNEAWRSFFALLKLQKQGKLPPHVRKVSPPRYWKDRLLNKRKLMTVIRNDCYRIEEVDGKKWLVLPKGLRIRITGEIRWKGKQGRLEIFYDDLTGRWYAYQSVEVDQPRRTTSPEKRAFVDLGVVNIITAWIEGERQPIAFSGKPLLADWWYWTKKIAYYQSIAMKVNGKYTTKRIRKLYRKRQLRFRHAVNTITHRFIKLCYEKGVSEIIVGDVRGIRQNNDKNAKANAMIHNFWSFRYIINRLIATAENFGIKVKLVKENHTSSVCPRCGSKNTYKHKRLFKCLDCRLEAHRDVVGVLNIARIPLNRGDGFNGVLAHPVLLRVNPVEAQTFPLGILALQCGEEVKTLKAHNRRKHLPYLKSCPICGYKFKGGNDVTCHAYKMFVNKNCEAHAILWVLTTKRSNCQRLLKEKYEEALNIALTLLEKGFRFGGDKLGRYGWIIFRNESALKHLLEHGVVYTLRRMMRKQGVVKLKNGNRRTIGLAKVTYIGKVHANGGEPVVKINGKEIPLRNFVRDSGFESLEDWLNAYYEIFGVKCVGGARLYKVELVKTFWWSKCVAEDAESEYSD